MLISHYAQSDGVKNKLIKFFFLFLDLRSIKDVFCHLLGIVAVSEVLKRLPSVLTVLLMIQEELGSHDLLLKLRGSFLFSLILNIKEGNLKVNLL